MREMLVELIEKTGMVENKNRCNIIAEELIANGVTIQRWIPVTERLPQEDQPLGALCEVVQVLLEDNTVTVGYCNRGMQLWFYLPLRGTHFVGTGFERSLVVAWMPLPDAPGGERKGNDDV